jgi:hypothetical protein
VQKRTANNSAADLPNHPIGKNGGPTWLH